MSRLEVQLSFRCGDSPFCVISVVGSGEFHSQAEDGEAGECRGGGQYGGVSG